MEHAGFHSREGETELILKGQSQSSSFLLITSHECACSLHDMEN